MFNQPFYTNVQNKSCYDVNIYLMEHTVFNFLFTFLRIVPFKVILGFNCVKLKFFDKFEC